MTIVAIPDSIQIFLNSMKSVNDNVISSFEPVSILNHLNIIRFEFIILLTLLSFIVFNAFSILFIGFILFGLFF